MTIVSKVSLAVALIIESALPDFSHFEFAKIQFLSHPCKYFPLSFSFAKVQLSCATYLRGIHISTCRVSDLSYRFALVCGLV